MNKPKYKLGDIIQDDVSEVVEIITAIRPHLGTYRYKTQYDDPRDRNYTNRFATWYERTIDKFYTVIGNLFDKETKHA